LTGQMLDDSRYGPSPATGTGNSLTHILVAVPGAALAAGRLLAFNAGVRRLRRPASGDEQYSVSTPRLRARSPIASSPARARLAKPSMSPACPTPVKQRHLADARFLRSTSIALSSLRAAASMHSSASGPGLDGQPMAFM
jgi:hypothetical protein